MGENYKSYTETELISLTTAELEKIYDEILNDLPSRAPIYLPTERISLVDRILGVQHVRQIYQHDLDAIYRPRLRALREKYQGSKRCFLIGNGPSLNKTDLSVLRDEVTFAVNGFFLKAQELGWMPTFYVVEDHLVAEDRYTALKRLKGTTKLFPAYLGYVFDASEDTIFYNHRPRKSYPAGFDFSLRADEITYTGCTVTLSLMQLAAFMGFEEIYLVGVDASYQIPDDAKTGKDYSVGVLDMKSDDPNHFNPDYFGKGYRWHDPQVENMVEAYAEAKKTLHGTGQTIFNATVGGKLEVFERREFSALFDCVRSAERLRLHHIGLEAKKYPRVLVLDMTPAGNGTATGELKATLFNGWPKHRYLQIARHGVTGLGLVTKEDAGNYRSIGIPAAEANSSIDEFDPDLILYRPVPKVPWLHEFAMSTIGRFDRPLVTWIMDDWPSDIARRDTNEDAGLLEDLNRLLQASALRLSISDAMSVAFEARYGVPFTAFANGINPVDWPPLRHHQPGPVLLRYSGGLAENMTLRSVLRIARVVDTLASEGLDIRFEINTQPWWYRSSRHFFRSMRNTTLSCVERRPEEYRAWMSEADINVIAYNHDEETRRYVQYSMANKIPECLASGAVTFVHGPAGLASVDYTQAVDCAVVIDEASDAAVAQALKSIATDAARRNAFARRARQLAFLRHDVTVLKERFREALRNVGKSALEQCPQAIVGGYREFLAANGNGTIDPHPCLRKANQFARMGDYVNALAHYVALTDSCRDQASPMPRWYARNAQYVAGKLGIQGLKKMQNTQQ